MSNLTIGVEAPAALTLLRDKIAAGERITREEALRVCELEEWLTRKCNEVADQRIREMMVQGGDDALG